MKKEDLVKMREKIEERNERYEGEAREEVKMEIIDEIFAKFIPEEAWYKTEKGEKGGEFFTSYALYKTAEEQVEIKKTYDTRKVPISKWFVDGEEKADLLDIFDYLVLCHKNLLRKSEIESLQEWLVEYYDTERELNKCYYESIENHIAKELWELLKDKIQIKEVGKIKKTNEMLKVEMEIKFLNNVYSTTMSIFEDGKKYIHPTNMQDDIYLTGVVVACLKSKGFEMERMYMHGGTTACYMFIFGAIDWCVLKMMRQQNKIAMQELYDANLKEKIDKAMSKIY